MSLLEYLSNKFFSKSPSKMAWVIIWMILAIIYAVRLKETYFDIKGKIENSPIFIRYV